MAYDLHFLLSPQDFELISRVSHKLALNKATEEYEKYKPRLLEEQHQDSIKELDEHLKQLLPGKQE